MSKFFDDAWLATNKLTTNVEPCRTRSATSSATVAAASW